MPEPLRIALVVLATAGCGWWLLGVVFARRVVRAAPRLDALQLSEPPRWASLSLISPACNEVAELQATTASRLASDHPDLELVLVDDRSTDGTTELVDRLAASDPRVKALHVRELPDGWLGKVHAMQVGLDASRGEWVLLSDADVHLAPQALRRAQAFCEQHGLDHLAIFPRIHLTDLLVGAAISGFGRAFTVGMRPWAVSNPRSKAAIGIGAFNLVRRSALDRIGGFERLRLEVADDIALARQLKASGARCGIANGADLVSLHWYRSLGEMARGLEKGLFAYGGRCRAWRLILAALCMLTLELSPWLALAPLGVTWLPWLGLVALTAGLATAGVMEAWIGRPPSRAVLQPLGALLMFGIMVRAALLGWRRGGVLWRGTLYPSTQLREAMRREQVRLASPGPPSGEGVHPA
jgi:hypothetical protein